MILLFLTIVLSGCVFTHPPLASDEFGKAARCHWIGNWPYFCQYDPSRVTVDQETLQDAIDTLEQHKKEAFERRSL